MTIPAPPSDQPLDQWSACQIADAVRSRRVTVAAVVKQVLCCFAEVDPIIRAYAVVDAEGVGSAASALDTLIRSGEVVGPLAGVPFSVKDLVPAEGLETSFRSHVFAGNVPAKDAVAVERLRKAGAILLRKTTTPEFGHKALTSSPRYGHTRNACALDRSPRGSSGGSCAAMEAPLGPISLATDGSGSSPTPGSACRMLGLNPTQGLIPNENAVELFTNFITLGLAARNADDLALALGVVAGAHAADPRSRALPRTRYAATSNLLEVLPRLRIRVIRKTGNERLGVATQQRLDELLSLLRSAGAQVNDGADPQMDWGGKTMFAMMRGYQQHRLKAMGREHAQRIDPTLVQALREGGAQHAEELQRALSDRADLYRQEEALFADADVLLTATVSAAAPRVDHRRDEDFSIDDAVVGPLRQQWYCYTGAFNLAGRPALSVPIELDSAGMPLGAQFVGPWFSESRLIHLAAPVEQMMPFSALRPNLPPGKAALAQSGWLAYPSAGGHTA